MRQDRPRKAWRLFACLKQLAHTAIANSVPHLFMVELANPATSSFSPGLNDYHHPSSDNEDCIAMPDSRASPALDHIRQRTGRVLEAGNGPSGGHIRKRTVRANGLDFPILEAGSGPSCYACTDFPIMHGAGFTFSIVSRGKDIGPSRRRCEDIGSVAPHPTDPTAPWRPGGTY